LALTQDEAQQVILASKTLEVTFALLTKGSDVKEDLPETTNNDVLP
jgi:hypothetical protein